MALKLPVYMDYHATTPVDPRVRRIVDVKCPGSGEAENNRWENLDALRESSGRRDAAADALGMSRSTLWRKMREYRISN